MKEFTMHDSLVFEHNTYNSITKEVDLYIKSKSISKIYIVGIYTDVSILLSAMLFFDMEVEVFVIGDACNSVHKNQKNDLHLSSLESLSHILGKNHIVDTEDLFK